MTEEKERIEETTEEWSARMYEEGIVKEPIEEEPETKAIEVRPQTGLSANEAMNLGSIAVQALVGGSANQAEAAMKIIRGHELGVGPAASIENIYVVNQKTAMSAGLIGALIKGSDKYDYKVVEHDTEHCKMDFLEDGELCGVSEFTMDDAKQAKLVKSNSPWINYPKNMLFARALTNGARWYCPDVFQGHVYTPEELGDRVVTASPAPSGYQASAQPVQSNPVLEDWRSTVPQAVVGAVIEPFVREVYDSTIGWETEECPIHRNHPDALASAVFRGQARPVAFFKAGRMRDYAHKVSGSEWCNRTEIIKNLVSEVLDLRDSKMVDLDELLKESYPDLEGIDQPSWRAQDWFDIRERLSDIVAEGTVEEDTDSLDPSIQ
jgi:hypothetical protein